MSLAAIMSSATTGLAAAQTGLRAVSDNIANVNTEGYVRKVVDQAPLVSAGMGVGVDILQVRRAADAFLQRATLSARAASSQAGVLAEAYDRAQALFGDPAGTSSFFDRLDEVYGAFSAAAADAASTIQRGKAIDAVTDFLAEASRISTSLNQLGGEADSRIGGAVDRANELLRQIESLNTDISRAVVEGREAAGSENIQSRLIDELAGLVDVSVGSRGNGGVVIRASDGSVLAGAGGAATLSYVRADDATGQIAVTFPGGTSLQALPLRLTSGELRGLLDLRDRELPALGEQLSEFVARAVEEINRAHNAAAAAPPPSVLTGRDTGLDMATALGGFTGRTTIALTTAAGGLARRIDIDFDAGTLSVDGGAATAFSAASFAADLSAAMGALGSASFSGGALTLSASAGGVAVVDDPTTPALKAGKGFSHFLGLNDLVVSRGFASYDTGLAATDSHGFTAGDVISFRVNDADGVRFRDVPVTIPAGASMQNLIDALNATAGGVGLYGSFSLDAKGALTFSSANGSTLTVLSDETERGAGGPSVSELFGIGQAQRSNRAQQFSVRSDIVANSLKLALANVDLAQAAAGRPVVAVGDGRGALALAQAGETITGFAAAGGLAATSTTVSRYASELAGSIARKADAATSRQEIAESVAAEADARRASAEGVNLDQELISMTTYQQAFNAAARLVQASKDMYDILLTMMLD
ncbi:MAG: flagellar hook-associated protein FlgK [Pseudomonadota bacterium]